MLKPVAILVMALLWGLTAWSQDPGEGQDEEQQQQEQVAEPEDDTGQESADAATSEVADIDDPSLDDQTYGGDDNVFIPTEEVPVDEPIPFPTDI